MKTEEYVRNCKDEDELRTLAKIRHPRDWKSHVETLGPYYWIRIRYEKEIEELMVELRKQAQKELARRKSLEKRKDKVQRKKQLEERGKIFAEISRRLVIDSEKRAQISILNDGISWNCPTRGCSERQIVDFVEDTVRPASIHEFVTQHSSRKGSDVLADARTGQEIPRSPIVDDLTAGNEVTLVMRCPRCFVADTLKIRLRRV